ncbi:MAG: di-heme oxidoredictase family protein [Bacteroidota bacterium]
MKKRLVIAGLIGVALSCWYCSFHSDFSAEELSGGENYTTYNFSKDAFGIQANNLEREESRLFVAGNQLFRSNWVAAPASVGSLDGLGPLFNAPSCGSCHFKDGRAAPPDEPNSTAFGLLWRLSTGAEDSRGGPLAHAIYGGQIQDRALPQIEAEARVEMQYDTIRSTYPDGTHYTLYKPRYELVDLSYGSLDREYQLSPRIAPQLAGIGLLENIPVADILANEDIADEDGDGISGKANYVWDVLKNDLSLGRFGWKANQPSILQQNAGAFNGDMGLTSSLFPKDEFTPYQVEQSPPVYEHEEPEISDRQLDRITLYVKTLAIPAKRNVATPEYARGRSLFYDIGCESCHKASFVTGDDDELAVLNQQKIYPYTDLLLHDMGEGLADHSPDYEATGREWRTAPLWGIGLIKTVNKHTRLLHDGRARNTEQAILWHDGEAATSKEKFKSLSAEERQALIFFVESL